MLGVAELQLSLIRDHSIYQSKAYFFQIHGLYNVDSDNDQRLFQRRQHGRQDLL